MYHIKVLASLDDRLDAEFYNPDALRTIQRMEDVGEVVTLGSLIQEGYRVVYHGTDSINGLKQNQLLSFLSPTQIDKDGAISFETADQLPKHYKYEYPKGLAKEGELLVEVKGNVSKVAVVPSVFPKNLMISGSLYKASINQNKADTHYVLAFLKSASGQVLKDRLTSNTIINYIAKDALYSIPVLKISMLAQKYIGEKVRQAERLRAWAKQIEIDTHEVFNASIAWDKSVLDVKNYGYVKLAELDGRLDLKYNSPERLAVLRHLKKQRIEASPLSSICSISAMIGWKGLTTEFYRESGPWLLRGVEFKKGVIDTEGLVCVDEFKYNEQPQIHLKEGDLAFSKDGTIGKAIVIPKLRNRLAAGSTIARLRMKGSTNPYYLEFVFSHSIVQAQIESFATGIAQPHITQEWIAKLEIPKVDCEEKIAEYWNTHHLALNSAKSLTKLANLLVEDLIDGQLIESQLVAAQQALETGDDSLDRALLERMTTKGIDVESDPLFDDIDQLYDLLEQAKQALDADETIAEA